MFWLFVARGMAQGTVIGGLLGGAALLFAGHDMVWAPVAAAWFAGIMLGFIEREIRR
jgi:hypothetical protein